ncbi:MAG: hypothetical protein IKU32_00655 [Clostridia bacterium]|nr:hypothetical protein [Clostridia bacterium]
MEEFERILLAHLRKYRLMGPEDCAKLIYQSEFAGEHMISSPEQSLKWIRQEMDEAAPSRGDIYEDIGDGVFRLHLGPAKAAGISPEEINDKFVSSAGKATGTKGRQSQKIALLERLCSEGYTPFSVDELTAFLEKYRAAGCPALHHSHRFREAYKPHYRVVKP